MSIISDNVIPGNHGKTFETNAKTEEELDILKNAILEIEGIKDVMVSGNDFPTEITVHTSEMVSIEDIQHKAAKTTFHVIPKTLFSL
ncbi:heavy-metal-associated domain-containing protein [Jiulongibacter sediminis]|uniref:HMA domain-containing protein n=1 Tax=Jiulongibacter sediminis TaxID=1605367 RepID=A0A0N8H9Z2_9BACT|nr:heavy-metal-associated domain-containing protein [Jiulongibacter sediminis]KPM48724.1 hypothetical protein AFM12_09065 [Jiulongibacter sediminis]TBX25259.1 hypothetical protein TK44_09070 [Jiulongibacter sediminis]